MTDHALVTWTLERLAANYSAATADTTTPVLVDDGDGTIYRIDDDGTLNELGRRYQPDPKQTNIVTVSPNPDRQETPIGTEYDLRVEDGVGVLVEGELTAEGGEVDDAAAFETFVDAVRAALLVERTAYPSLNGVDYHTIIPETPSQTPESLNSDHYFAYTTNLIFRGYEDLP